MKTIPESIQHLIDQFARFQGIGKKTAQRLAFYLLKAPNEDAAQLAKAVMDVKTKILSCSVCGGITESDPCVVCSDPKRDNRLICIVEEQSDVYAFERTGTYNGVYHVLGGVLSPLDGIGPDDLNIDNLVRRTRDGMEIIVATNPSIEGETTALYLSKLFQDKNVNVTRLARGLPVGSALEYIDDATLMRAIEGRTKL